MSTKNATITEFVEQARLALVIAKIVENGGTAKDVEAFVSSLRKAIR